MFHVIVICLVRALESLPTPSNDSRCGKGEYVSQQAPQVEVVDDESGQGGGPVINDFSIQVATVNGSGSQSANLVLMRSILIKHLALPFGNSLSSSSKKEQHCL